MSVAAKPSTLPDELDRRRAIGTFDRNLVVTAGAGTGKTTLLVDRLVHLLLRNPEPLRITEIVALTFTNKAANEMKQRLRDRLQSYLDINLQTEPTDERQKNSQLEVNALIQLYQLSKDEIDSRVRHALRNLERADIGTIHSFAATLLRLYPLEAGVDPQFREDEGKQFDRIFDEQWDLWLDQELSLGSDRADDWRKILKKVDLEELKALARSMGSENLELHRDDTNQKQHEWLLRSWLCGLLNGVAALGERHPEDRVNEQLVRASGEIIRGHLDANGLSAIAPSHQKAYLSVHSIDRNTKGWSEADVEQAQAIVRVAKGLCKMDAPLTKLIWQTLVPFAEHFRMVFVRAGFVSFDGLLIRARNLVRDHLHVRAELKRRYLSILIDEFQDTDPIQYEILLYLAEKIGNAARDWRKVELTPGKVFVVGDPKQSIYAFRRADIEAYLEVVEKTIKAQNGIECRLTTNFRSTEAIVDVVNGVFSSLIQAQPGLQPPYIGIDPAPQRTSQPAKQRQRVNTLPPVLIRKVVAQSGEMNAEKSRRLEGESLAAWLKDDLFEKISFANEKGEHVLVQPRDVAILFRKLTDIYDYLEPLRRRGIRYVVEGERHFYAAKEIIDAVNLLRAIDNPHDRLALVGVLRSPLGGVTDQTIYDLHSENLLDYRAWNRLSDKNFAPTLAELYRTLAELHVTCGTLPLGEAVSHIFATLPLKPLAACYFHGEQAVANLEKLRQQAELLGREDGSMTFKEAIRQLQDRVLNVKEEGESVLAEENVDALRIMSIHKSKGLEFPIVVLAGCQTGIDEHQNRMAEALYDWSAGLNGIHVGAFTDLAGLYISEKNRLRAKEEQKRVFYVAATRAREHLIISSGPSANRSNGSFAAVLDDVTADRIGAAAESTVVAIGSGELELEIVEAALTPPGPAKSKKHTSEKKSNWRPFVETWARRGDAYAAAIKTPVFVTPTFLKAQEQDLEAAPQVTQLSQPRTAAMVVGELAHRLLESWDFTQETAAFADRIEPFLDRWLPADMQQEHARIQADLGQMFGCFFNSKIYSELARSKILGREVPLLMPWDSQIMEGVIDLVYDYNGGLYLADYKTDQISGKELPHRAERYRRQAQIYSQAVRQSLQRDVAAFKVIFLRLGESVEVALQNKRQPSQPVQLDLL